MTHTTCPYCGVGCGVVAQPDGTITGDTSHPSNAGRLCSKGAALAQTLDDGGRLTTPMIGGVAATWDAALDHVAARFRATIAAHGPDSVAFYVSGQFLTEDYYVANKLIKGFIGSANIDTNSRLCMASTVAGHVRAFGEDVVPGIYEDWECADLVVLVGSNTAWCHPVLHQRLQAARATRAIRVVAIDPRRTATAEEADLHLPLAPDSDVLLFNGLLAHLAACGAVDHDWVGRHTSGFAETLANAQAEAGDVARVAAGCDVDPALVARFYGWFAETRRVVTVFSQGVNQSASGTDKVNAIINCHLATGRIGIPGAGPFSVTGQPNAMGGREVGGLANQLAAHLRFDRPGDLDLVRRFWRAPNLATQPGLKAVDLFDAVADGRVKAVWIAATNPAASMPRADHVRAALAACPFVVVADCWETDTTHFADVVLPAAAWGEKDGTVTSSERMISRQRPFRAAPGEARPDWWMFAELGRRMGWGEAFAWETPAEVFAEHAALSGFENDGARVFDIAAAASLDYDAMAPMRWPLGSGRLFADGGFPTPDGRARLIPLSQPASSGDGFVLNTGRVRDQWHTMTRTGRVARLMTHVSEPLLAIHPDDADALGLADGTLARIETASGEHVLPVSRTATQRHGEIFVPMHWTRTHASSGPIDRTVASLCDPISGQPALKATRARIAPVRTEFHGLLLRRRGGTLPALCHWTRRTVEGGEAFRLAGLAPMPDDADAFAAELLAVEADAEWLEMADPARLVLRRAAIVDGLLEAAIFLAREAAWLPAEEAILPLLGQPVPAGARWRVLVGGTSEPGADTGPRLCACFGVGRETVREAASLHGIRDVAGIGALLRAGTNCGSCVPEMRQLLRELPAPALAQVVHE